MAPPKKPEADKAKKINFTLSPAMFEAFKTKCLQEGKEISKTLQGLIEMFIDEKIPSPAPVSAPTIDGNDTSVIQELLSRIEILEQNQSRNDNPVIDTHSINIESTQEETTITSTQKPAIDVLPVTPMDVSPDPVNENSVATNEVSIKEMVFHVLGHEIPTDDPVYDTISKRIKRLLAKNNVINLKRGIYPREEALQIIDTNIEELKKQKKPSKED